MSKWLNENLKQEIKTVFEPRYKRKLTNKEILTIAENLTSVMETFLKLKARKKYKNENANTRS